MILPYDDVRRFYASVERSSTSQRKIVKSDIPYFILGIVVIVLAVMTLRGVASPQLLIVAVIASVFKCF